MRKKSFYEMYSFLITVVIKNENTLFSAESRPQDITRISGY